MLIQSELLEILICPASKQSLRPATNSELESLNSRIRSGSQRNEGGTIVEKPLEEGLVREDGCLLYPVTDGIPVMLVDEAFRLNS